MPVPTHSVGCETRIWGTKCPDCGDAVYFFSCSCGSKVFFDLNRPPWIPHEDRCLAYRIRYLREVEGYSGIALRQMIDNFASDRGLKVPPEVYALLPRLHKKGQITTIEVNVGSGEYELTGQVLSVSNANFFRRFNYADNSMGRGLLGELASEPFVEVVMREETDEEARLVNQFTFFIPRRCFDWSGVRVSSEARALLVPHTVPGKGQIRLADEIVLVDD